MTVLISLIDLLNEGVVAYLKYFCDLFGISGVCDLFEVVASRGERPLLQTGRTAAAGRPPSPPACSCNATAVQCQTVPSGRCLQQCITSLHITQSDDLLYHAR